MLYAIWRFDGCQSFLLSTCMVMAVTEKGGELCTVYWPDIWFHFTCDNTELVWGVLCSAAIFILKEERRKILGSMFEYFGFFSPWKIFIANYKISNCSTDGSEKVSKKPSFVSAHIIDQRYMAQACSHHFGDISK